MIGAHIPVYLFSDSEPLCHGCTENLFTEEIRLTGKPLDELVGQGKLRDSAGVLVETVSAYFLEFPECLDEDCPEGEELARWAAANGAEGPGNNWRIHYHVPTCADCGDDLV